MQQNRSLTRLCAAISDQIDALMRPAGQLSRYGLGRMLSLSADALASLTTESRGTPNSLGDQLLLRELAGDEIAEQISELMGTEDAPTLARQLAPQLADLAALLGQARFSNTVTSRFGPIRAIDYLRGLNVVLVDLAIDTKGIAQPAATAEAVRALAQVIAERHPGRSIELRVPPYAAVQLGAQAEGPIHTRGTPPNVVETDPQTFLALAIARQSWTRAAEAGRLNHSGAHAAEVAQVFPVFKPR